MQITVKVPTIADLPKDFKSTFFGMFTAVTTLLVSYFQTGSVTLPVAAACVVVAIVCYMMPAKIKSTDEINIAEQVEKIVTDILAKNAAATLADGEALEASVTKTVLATLSVQQASATAPGAPPAANLILSGTPLNNTGAQANLGA